MLTVQEAAEKAGVHTNTILLWIETGQLEAKQWGRQWAIKAGDLAKAIRRRRPRGRPLGSKSKDDKADEGKAGG